MNPILTPTRITTLTLVAAMLTAAVPVATEAQTPSDAAASASAPEVRVASGFRAIDVRGSMRVVLRQGPREGVELVGDAAALRSIETRVIDRAGVPTLQLGTARGGSWFGWPWGAPPVTATVEFVALESLQVTGDGHVTAASVKTPTLAVAVSGSGDLRLAGIEAQSVSAQLSGSGDISLAGRSAQLRVSIAGSGDVDTRQLEADAVEVSVAGSGDARVTARQTLAVSVAGSGDVSYAGEARLTSQISGSGSVRKR